MAIHCAYGLCNSDSRYKHKDYMKGVEFIPFPKPSDNLVKCQRWVNACGRSGFNYNHVTKNTYICTKHFVGEKGPTYENPYPIPLHQVGDHTYTYKTKKNPFSSHKTCSVPQCLGRANSQMSLHQFPTCPEYRQKWISAFMMEWMPKNPFACSMHFSKEQYHFEAPSRMRHRLKRNAIPTLKLPDPTKEESFRSRKASRGHAMKQKVQKLLESIDTESDEDDTDDALSDRLAEDILTKYSRGRHTKSSHNKDIEMMFNKKDFSRTPVSNRKQLLPEITTRCNEREGRGGFKMMKTSAQNHEAHDNEVEIPDSISVKHEPPDVIEDNKIVVKSENENSEYLFGPIDCAVPTTNFTNIKEEPIDDFEEPTNYAKEASNNLEEAIVEFCEPFSNSDFPARNISRSKITVLFKSRKIHVPDFIDCVRKPHQKECAVCCKKVLSKEVCTFCPDCPDTPPLCLQKCFRSYHGY